MYLSIREKEVLGKAEYFTCINWKPLGNKQKFEFPTEKEATTKAKEILKANNKAKILIYSVKGTNQALINTFRGRVGNN